MKRGDLCKVVPADTDDPLANRLAGQVIVFDREPKHTLKCMVVAQHPDTGEFIWLRKQDIKEIEYDR